MEAFKVPDLKLPSRPIPPAGKKVPKLHNEVPRQGIDISQLKGAHELFNSNRNTSDLLNSNDSIAKMTRISSMFSKTERFNNLLNPSVDMPVRIPYIPHIPPRHDPEAFYFEQWPSDAPIASGSLTCDLWRHKSEGHVFDIDVIFCKDEPMQASILTCVQAENLSQPVEHRTKVELVYEEFSPYEQAMLLVSKLRGT